MNTIKPKEDDTNHGFEFVKQTNPIVYKVLRSGGTLKDCIVALDKFGLDLQFKIFELQSIAPRKIKGPDGKIMVWHCPDNLVPLTEM